MKASDVLNSLIGFKNHCLWSPMSVIAVPNSHGLVGYEADLLILRESGWLDEVEIKVSASDFRREFTAKTKQRKHDKLRTGVSFFPAEPIAIRHFYFAMPLDVFQKVQNEVPEYAGIILVDPPKVDQFGHMVPWVHKTPSKLPRAVKASDKFKARMLTLAHGRLWSLLASRAEDSFCLVPTDEPASDDPPPLPSEAMPWLENYHPGQLSDFLTRYTGWNRLSGTQCATYADIQKDDALRILQEYDRVCKWAYKADPKARAKYLNDMLRINKIRFDRTYAGGSGFQGFFPDEPAPVSSDDTSTNTPPTAGDSTQDEPAATSLDTLPKQQSGGNPAPHFFRQGGPMLPSEHEPWYGKFKPDQIHKVLWHWVFVEGNALCCAETTGMSVEECFDIASIYMRELEWSLYARREDAAAYLNNLHRINQTRYELTIWPRQKKAKKEQGK